MTDKRYQVNNRIRAKELRVITADGENLGVITTQEALFQAQKRELDLVVIAEGANPPVAKILDFNKYLYDENKKAASTKGKKSELKEFRFGPAIGEGDIQTRIRRAREFLLDKNQVKFTVHMRGRQAAYPDIAVAKLQRIITELGDVAKPDGDVKLRGPFAFVTLIAK